MSNKTFTFEQLKKIAEKHSVTTVKETSSGKILATEYGARLLGLFPAADLPNTLWIDADIENKMATANWLVGGERLWIAPERNFFYENPRDFDGFHVPADIDPGEYEAVGDMDYRSYFTLLNYQTNEPYDNSEASRKFEVIKDPFNTGLAYAGVSIKDRISVPVPNLTFCCWSLSQIYTCGGSQPGTAFYPIKPNGKILSYFNPIPSTRADVQDGYARFKIDSEEIYKLAIKPEDMVFDNPTKAVYLSPYPGSTKWFCLIKRTNDMPRTQEECVDVPKSNPESGLKGAIQSYNNGPGFDDPVPPFGEIELQLNKGTTVGNRTISMAFHELLSYAGTKDQMLELAATALDIGNKPKLYK